MSASKVSVTECVRCPVGYEINECDVVFVGDSIFKHLYQYLLKVVDNLGPGVYFRSGACIDDLRDQCVQIIGDKTQMCAIHLRTNDLEVASNSVGRVFDLWKSVMNDVHENHSRCEIFISSVILRGHNLWNKSPRPQGRPIDHLNSRILEFNALVEAYCQTRVLFHSIDNDAEFRPQGQGQGIKANLLAKDGLHLSIINLDTLAKYAVCKTEESSVSMSYMFN